MPNQNNSQKPDIYKRGHVYLCDLPKQLVGERTDNIIRHRDGTERHGLPTCIVISQDDFNNSQSSGLIVVPMISGVHVDLSKFRRIPSTWVRVINQGEPGYALVEQVRYVDRGRCKARVSELTEFDVGQVGNKLKWLLLGFT